MRSWTKRATKTVPRRTRGLQRRRRQITPKRLRPNRFAVKSLRTTAQARLKKFRQGSTLAVAITGFLLLLWGQPSETPAQSTQEVAAAEVTATNLPPSDPSESLEQATNTLRDLLLNVYGFLPKIGIVLVLLLIAAILARLIRLILMRALASWERASAITALLNICIYIAAIAAGMSILAGDVRALIGSLGLIGLALSWALQTPIESFTGWLLNSFRGYYRVGDRIEVGEVFGDVYKIDILTTTVWEAGGPNKAVAGAQSTGAMITFPNWEVLRSNVVNYSREFPFVWDGVTVGVANESDLRYTVDVLEHTAGRVLGPLMTEPVAQYRRLLEKARVSLDVEEKPRVFLSTADAWTNCTVRYLVSARARRRWSTALLLALSEEIAKPEHRGKIIPAYPRTEVRMRDNWSPQTNP